MAGDNFTKEITVVAVDVELPRVLFVPSLFPRDKTHFCHQVHMQTRVVLKSRCWLMAGAVKNIL